MFIDNKYTKFYMNIINNAQILNRKKGCGTYLEAHHIIPSSIGGNNLKGNKVLLTAREHFICHRLLTKMTTGKDKIRMLHALSFFTTRNITGRQHQLACEANSSAKQGVNNPMYNRVPWNKGKSGYLSEEALANIEAGRKEWYDNGGMTDEYINKISKTLKGRPKPKGFGGKVSESISGDKHWSFKGYYHTPEGKLSSSTTLNGIIPNQLVRRWCKNPNKIITKACYIQVPYLQTLGGEIIGKTFKGIGFFYEELS